jgi:hypothetical protein
VGDGKGLIRQRLWLKQPNLGKGLANALAQ